MCRFSVLSACFVVFLLQTDVDAVIVPDATVISSYVAESGTRSLAFGGLLLDSGGQPVNGSRSIGLNIYDVASGGTAFFSESGTFNVVDGRVAIRSIDVGTVNLTGGEFLEVTVDGNGTQRVPLSTANRVLTGTGFTFRGATSVSTFIPSSDGQRTASIGGLLKDASGQPVTGNHTISVSLHSSATGGTQFFSETIATSVTDGRVSSRLGLSTSLPSSLSGEEFVEVSIDGQPAQRVPLNSVGETLTFGSGLTLERTNVLSAYVEDQGERTLSFGGKLTDDFGVPLTGNLSLSFSLYATETGGSATYSENVAVTTSDGEVTVDLGVSPDEFDTFSEPWFLEIAKDGLPIERFALNTSRFTQLTAIPEPSAFLFGCLVCVGFVLRRS